MSKGFTTFTTTWNDPYAHDYSEDIATESYKRLSAKYFKGRLTENDFDTAHRVGQIIKAEGRKYSRWDKEYVD